MKTKIGIGLGTVLLSLLFLTLVNSNPEAKLGFA